MLHHPGSRSLHIRLWNPRSAGSAARLEGLPPLPKTSPLIWAMRVNNCWGMGERWGRGASETLAYHGRGCGEPHDVSLAGAVPLPPLDSTSPAIHSESLCHGNLAYHG